MVANLSMEGQDIPFTRLLYTNKTEEVARALSSVMCQIVSMAQGAPPIFRIHTQVASSQAVHFRKRLNVVACGRLRAYVPRQNGKAERLVGIMKQLEHFFCTHVCLCNYGAKQSWKQLSCDDAKP